MQPTMRVFTAEDHDRLRQFISAHETRLAREAQALAQLSRRVEEGEVVSVDEVSSDLVTMYSQIRVHDVDNGRSCIVTVALPSERDSHRESTLPAVELIGARVGDELAWSSVSGQRRARVEEVLFQPEASSKHSRGHARPAVGTRPSSVSLPSQVGQDRPFSPISEAMGARSFQEQRMRI